MKPNTVVLGYFSPIKDTPRALLDDQAAKLPGNVRDLIRQFPDDGENLTVPDYVAILKDINLSGKNLLIARKYASLMFYFYYLKSNICSFEKLDMQYIKRNSGIRDKFPHFGVPSPSIASVGI